MSALSVHHVPHAMVHQHQWPLEACHFHDALGHAILSREAHDQGLRVSNVGGWHSRPDLHAWEEDGIAPLIERLAIDAERVGAGARLS